MHVDAGEELFQQGDKSDGMYIVLSGRLRAIQQSMPMHLFLSLSLSLPFVVA